MKDTQILSAFQEPAPVPEAAPVEPVLVFDACQIGVVLRAVLLVELSVAVAVMFVATDARDWVLRLSLGTAAALPAVLGWVVVACACKRLLARLPVRVQTLAGVLLGALAGVYGCGLLVLAGLLGNPPWAASACSGALLAALLVGVLVMRAKGRRPADASARLAQLQSRIRPHFLFNTLNSAIALVRAEPAKAEALLEDLSDLFRYSLRDQADAVTLAQEIALAQRYLAIEQVRFGQRLQVQWALDPRADAVKLPSLLLQPLVENAVRHGVEPSPSGAEIKISTQHRGDVVVIKVTNTVPAGPGPAGQGLALANVRERLGLMYDVQGQLRSGLRDGVYQVRIEVPL